MIGNKVFRPHKVGLKLNRVISMGQKLPTNSQNILGQLAHTPNGVINNVSNSADMQYDPIKGHIPKAHTHKTYAIEKPRRSRAGSDDKYA
jgi:hypothetical protein